MAVKGSIAGPAKGLVGPVPDDQTGTLPTGGTAGQPLVKDSSTDYDASWQTLGVVGGGTGADLSATGGSGQYLKQSTLGGAITVGAISAADVTLTIGTTPVSGATSGNYLYNNGGVLGQISGANLTALAGLTGAADTGFYFTGAGAMSTYSLTSFGRSLGGAATAAAGVSLLGLREQLSSSQTYYVDKLTGSDSNDGSIGSPWATLQHAANWIMGQVDTRTADVEVIVGDGVNVQTYVESLQVGSYVGRGYKSHNTVVMFRSNGGDPSKVIIAPTVGSAAFVGVGTSFNEWGLENITVAAVGLGANVLADAGSWLYLKGVVFSGTPGAHVAVEWGGIVELDPDPGVIDTGASTFITCIGGYALFQGGTMTATGTPAFSSAFAYVDTAGIIEAAGVTFPTCTGPKWIRAGGGQFNIGGADPNTLFPGSSNGSDTNVYQGTWNGNKIGLAYGGTNADLSATGGTGQYVKQAGVGAALTVGTIPSTDVTGLGTFATQNYATPPAIGGTTPAAGAFTTLSASSTVSGSGFSTYLAAPPAIGGTTPAAGSFTTLSAGSGTFTVSASGALASNIGIGTAPVSTVGIFYSGTVTGGTDSAGVQLSPSFTSVTSTSLYGVALAPAIAAGSATITNFYGIRSEALFVGAGSSATNVYGLYLDTQTAGGTLNRTLYTAGGTNQFAGSSIVVVGSPGSVTSAVPFQVNVTSNVNVGIYNNGGTGAIDGFTDGFGARLTLFFNGAMKVGPATGVQLGSPTGGDKGLGTLNTAGDIYKNNSAYANPDFVFEHFYNGDIIKFKESPGAAQYNGLMPLKELREYTQTNFRLPGITNEPMGMFERGDFALRYIEEAMLYLMDHNEKIDTLCEKVASIENRMN